MKIIEKLKKDKKLLFIAIGLVIATFSVPYLTISGLILWWFYKKSKFSKRAKVILTAIIGGLFTLLITGSVIAYSIDAEPHLNIAEPSFNTAVKGQKVTIRGTYDPIDRKVWVNGKEITASNGNFEYSYELKEGKNEIDVSAGNWKRTHVSLIVTRELTDEEKAARITPTATPIPTISQQILNSPTVAPKVSVTQQSDLYPVVSVIDGDTLQVLINGNKETIRLIGIDTPETVDPRKSVQCFGQEASTKAKSILTGKQVRLEADSTQGERDKYQRLLRYLFLEDGTNFDKLMISEGYAYEYTYNTPYKYQAEFKQAQKEAETGKRGLWADNACLATPTPTLTKSSTTTSNYSNSTVNTTSSFSCAGKTTCGQMVSCAEAKFYLNTCGISRLDGDKDGVPCESLCN